MRTALLAVVILGVSTWCFEGASEKSIKVTDAGSNPVYFASVWEDLGLGDSAAENECKRFKEKMNTAKKNWKESKQKDKDEYRRVKEYEKRIRDDKTKGTKEVWKETEKIDKDEYRRVKAYEERYHNPRLGGSADQNVYSTERTVKAKKRYEKAKAKYKKCVERYNQR